MDWKTKHNIEQIHRTAYKKYECFILTNLIHDAEFSDLQACTQHYVKKKDGKYALIDLYYPQLNVAVEIDEPYHAINQYQDRLRQNDIENQLGCCFYRFNIAEKNLIAQLAEFKELLRARYCEEKGNGTFSEWSEPSVLDIAEAKKQLKNTLFIKIRGIIPPEKLDDRQTCCWRISERKKAKVEQIVVIHDSLVIRVTRTPQWSKENGKYSYKGDIVEGSELMGTIIQDWKTQQTITYSNDIK